MIAKKTLGQHIEQGLTYLADRGYQIQRENREHNDESISLGLVSDADKLRMLKADLYRKARAGGEVGDLVAAIETLETSLQLEFQRQNTLEAVAARFCTSCFLIVIGATILSFPTTWICGSNQSRVCQNSKAISTTVVSQFLKPKRLNKVLPANLK